MQFPLTLLVVGCLLALHSRTRTYNSNNNSRPQVNHQIEVLLEYIRNCISKLTSRHRPSVRTHILQTLLLLVSGDISHNPGPLTPKYPCGVYRKAVRWGQDAVRCDHCETWYHIPCIHMNHTTYQILTDNSNTSWICCQCGMPSFSSSPFNTTPVDLSNSFSSFNSNSSSPLTINSPLHPLHTSTPNPPNRTRQTIRPTAFSIPLRIVNINFQSCKNKLQELQHIAHSVKLDVIIGTETWLQPSITSNEIFKPEMGYTLNRKDRSNQAYGGVLTSVRSELVSSACPDLDTGCELLWVQIDPTGAKSLHIGAFYRPPDSDVTTLENLNQSLHRTNGNIWLGGDFNAPHINWPLLEVTPLVPNDKFTNASLTSHYTTTLSK